MRQRYKTTPMDFTDIGSGLNTRRPRLRKLLALAKHNSLHTLIITYRGKLARFSFELIKGILQDYGAQLMVLFQLEHQIPQEGLVAEMMALVASCSGRVYALRGRTREESF